MNRPCLTALAQLSKDTADGTVTVEHDGVRRTLVVARGQLVASESTAAEDRLGALLVARAGLEAERVEQAATAARAEHRMLGEQLVRDGLMGPEALAHALEFQAVVRFERALLMHGAVARAPALRLPAAFHRPLSGLVVDVFRGAIPSADVEGILSEVPSAPLRFAGEPPPMADLALSTHELELWLRIRGGRNAPDRTDEKARRFLAAIWALGAVSA